MTLDIWSHATMKQEQQTTPARSKAVTCRFCGQTGLEWRRTKQGRWRLYPVGRKWPHVCRDYVPPDEDDDDEDEEGVDPWLRGETEEQGKLRDLFYAKAKALDKEESKVFVAFFDQSWEKLYQRLKDLVCMHLECDYYGQWSEALRREVRRRCTERHSRRMKRMKGEEGDGMTTVNPRSQRPPTPAPVCPKSGSSPSPAPGPV